MQALYLIRGIVRHGNKRGRKMGFPTANINLRQQIGEGIYASLVKFNKKVFKSVTFIGKAETFNESKYQAETFIFDFNGNLYDKWISVKIFKKLRGNIKFKSETELIKQMKRDADEAKEYLKNYKELSLSS